MRARREDMPLSMYHESLAQERLRDLDEEQRREAQARESFGGAYSYEDALGRLDAELDSLFGNDNMTWRHPPTFEDTFREIFDEAFTLLVERQRKYGPENVRTLGLYGVFTRIEDKMERIRHAFQGGMQNGVLDIREVNPTDDETLDDADLDAANYHLIRIALRRGVWGRPLAGEAT